MPGAKSTQGLCALVWFAREATELHLLDDVDMDGSVRSGLMQSCNKYSYFTVFTSNCVRVERVSREEDSAVIMQSNHVLSNTF